MSTEAVAAIPDNAQPDDWGALAVEHLQLDDRITQALKNCGIFSLGAALRLASGEDGRRFRHFLNLEEAVQQLSECTGADADGINWPRYWALRGWRLQHAAAAAREFEPLARYSGETLITRELLGNGGGLIRSTGTDTLADLIENLRTGMQPVRGLGRTKLADLFQRLLSLSALVSATGTPVGPAAGSGGAAAGIPPRPILPQEARALPVSVLSPRAKADWLRSAGYEIVGDLADADWRDLSTIPAVGPRTLRAIRERLLALSESSGEGGVNWTGWSSAQNLPLVPEGPVRSGAEMLARLPDVLARIQEHLSDEHCRIILAERICRLPRQQLTLEEIARAVIPQVTHERIRQKETALLQRIARAMIWGRGDRLEVQVHPSFSLWWRTAAQAFSGEEDVPFPEFVKRLAGLWSVGPADVLAHIAFISAVVTGDAQMPAGFRSRATLSPALLRLTSEARAIPLDRFRLGRTVDRLSRLGVSDLGGLVDAVLGGTVPHEVPAQLGAAAQSVRDDGSFSWAAYQQTAGLPPVPAEPPADAARFAAGFADTVTRILRAAAKAGRAAEIFELRTRHPEGRRPTLDATARALRTHRPSVKREETLLLQELHDVLIDRRFAALPVWLDADWLRFCDDAFGHAACAGGDYGWFLAALARDWAVPISTAECAAPALWAIFTGNPEGRRGRRTRRAAPSTPVQQPIASRIRLRGFRRLH